MQAEISPKTLAAVQVWGKDPPVILSGVMGSEVDQKARTRCIQVLQRNLRF